MYIADGGHISHVERDRVTEGLLRYIVHLLVGMTRFVMLLYVWLRFLVNEGEGEGGGGMGTGFKKLQFEVKGKNKPSTWWNFS